MNRERSIRHNSKLPRFRKGFRRLVQSTMSEMREDTDKPFRASVSKEIATPEPGAVLDAAQEVELPLRDGALPQEITPRPEQENPTSGTALGKRAISAALRQGTA